MVSQETLSCDSPHLNATTGSVKLNWGNHGIASESGPHKPRLRQHFCHDHGTLISLHKDTLNVEGSESKRGPTTPNAYTVNLEEAFFTTCVRPTFHISFA